MTRSATAVPVPPLGVLEGLDEAAIKVQIVRSALELEVIPAVAAGHHDPAAVARAIGCAEPGTRVLLDGLCALGLLRCEDEAYALTATAQAYLMPDSPAYCAPMYRADLRSCDGFTEAIRSGGADTDVAAANPAGLWPAYASSHLVRWSDEVPRYRERWAALGVTSASLPAARILDVGCGPAVASLVLALDDPAATVTGIDRGPVTEVAARVAAVMGLSARATFMAGDTAILADLDGPYDLVFFGHVFHFFGLTDIERTLRQTHRLLAPGGRVVILEVLRTPGDYEDPYPYLAAVWLFNVAPRGRVYTFEEFATLLSAAGFDEIRRLDRAPWLQAERSG